jgi:hypothetical protein
MAPLSDIGPDLCFCLIDPDRQTTLDKMGSCGQPDRACTNYCNGPFVRHSATFHISRAIELWVKIFLCCRGFLDVCAALGDEKVDECVHLPIVGSANKRRSLSLLADQSYLNQLL